MAAHPHRATSLHGAPESLCGRFFFYNFPLTVNTSPQRLLLLPTKKIGLTLSTAYRRYLCRIALDLATRIG